MKSKIGWIGLGNMGVPMVKRLVKAGHVVVVFNRTIEKTLALKKELNIQVVKQPADLPKDVDFIITMLANDEAVKTVYTASDGILAAQAGENVIVIDMSTVSPHTTLELSTLVVKKGMHYLDAPVSGSVKQAEEGGLVIMVGGAKEDYEKAKSIFDQLGKTSMLIGPTGAGNYTKLAVNLFLGATGQGLSEAVVFAERNGIRAEILLDIIRNGPLGSPWTNMKANSIIENNFTAAFALKHQAKDLRLAKEEGMNTPLGNAIVSSYDQALQMGLGEEDTIAILRFLRGKYMKERRQSSVSES